MIEANIYSGKDGIYRIRVDNHADSIVCAAVSALVINAVNYIDEALRCCCTLEMQDEQSIDFTVTGKMPQAQTILDFLAFGLKQIEQEYQDEIRVTTHQH